MRARHRVRSSGSGLAVLSHNRADVVFWGQWVLANLVGELFGLGLVGAAAYAAIYIFGEPEFAGHVLGFAVLAIGLGAIEGLIVGVAQANVIRRRVPALRAWVTATVVGAVIAWTLGVLPATVTSLLGSEPATSDAPVSDALQILLAIPLGVVTGAILGFPQWRVLKRHVARAGWWVVANALAWACAMPLVFAIAGAGSDATVLSGVATAVVGLAAAGALVGAIHGAFLVWLLAPLSITREAA